MKVIQVIVQDNEYESLSKRALAGGWPSVAEFIKAEMLPDNDFKKWFPVLMSQAERLPSGTTFTVSTLLGADWESIPKGVRLALGRVYYSQVAGKKIPGIKSAGNKNSSSQRYFKQEETI